eukprot:SAG11_NODE_3057_length_2722_cov_2.016012_2_plen_205_part_00
MQGQRRREWRPDAHGAHAPSAHTLPSVLLAASALPASAVAAVYDRRCTHETCFTSNHFTYPASASSPSSLDIATFGQLVQTYTCTHRPWLAGEQVMLRSSRGNQHVGPALARPQASEEAQAQIAAEDTIVQETVAEREARRRVKDAKEAREVAARQVGVKRQEVAMSKKEAEDAALFGTFLHEQAAQKKSQVWPGWVCEEFALC